MAPAIKGEFVHSAQLLSFHYVTVIVLSPEVTKKPSQSLNSKGAGETQ